LVVADHDAESTRFKSIIRQALVDGTVAEWAPFFATLGRHAIEFVDDKDRR